MLQVCNVFLPVTGTVYNLSALLTAGTALPLQARHCSYQLYATPYTAVRSLSMRGGLLSRGGLDSLCIFGMGENLAPPQLRFPAPTTFPLTTWQGNLDFLFTAQPGLSNPSTGISLQSVNYPTYYLGILPVSVSANTAEGSLRLGLMLPGAAAPDNATWAIVPGLAGGINTYSFQASDTPPRFCEHQRASACSCAELESHPGSRRPLHDALFRHNHGKLRWSKPLRGRCPVEWDQCGRCYLGYVSPAAILLVHAGKEASWSGGSVVAASTA